MADSRHVINLILKAQDDTSAALNSAIAKLGLLDKATAESKRQADEYGDAWVRVNSKIAASDKEMAAERDKIFKKIEIVTDDAIKKTVALEEATRSYVKTLGDSNKSAAERVLAFQRMTQATKDLQAALFEANEKEGKLSRSQALGAAQQIRNTEIKRQQTREQIRDAEELAIAEEKTAERRKKIDDEIVATRKRGMETIRRAQEAQLKDLLAKEEAAAQQRAKLEDIGLQAARQAERAKADIRNAQIEELNRLLEKEEEVQTRRAELEQLGVKATAQAEAAKRDIRRAQEGELNRLLAKEEEVAKRRAELEDIGIEAARKAEAARRDIRQAQEEQLDRLLKKEDEAAARRAELESLGIQAMRQAEKARADIRKTQEEELQRQLRLEEEAARAEQERNDRQKASVEEYIASLRKLRGIEAELQSARGQAGTQVVQARLELDAASTREQALALREELEARLQHIEANVDLDSGQFLAEAAEVELIKKLLSSDINIKVDVDESPVKRLGAAADDGGNKFRNLFSQISDGFGNSGNRIAAFDNLLRGLFSFLVVGFLQPLIVIAGAAGAALVALASSALLAGSALAGGLAAGAAQAVPVLGVLIGFLARFKGVLDVVKQSQLLQEQQSYKGAQQNKKLADTADAVAAAQKRLSDAQKNLTEARRLGVRQLTDLIEAERKAELAARGAALSQRDAQKALQEAIASGGDVARAQLDLDNANQSVRDTRISGNRASADAGRARAGGVEGLPSVIAAKSALEDASVALEKAGRTADIANTNISAAAGKLAFLMDKLSPAEQRLAKAIERFQELARGVAQTVTEPLINATTRGLEKVSAIITRGPVIAALTGLSEEMAKQGERIFDAFTDQKTGNLLGKFVEEARKNLEPLSDILINLGKTFLNIGDIAGPSFRKLLDYLVDVTKKFSDFTSSAEGKNTLKEYFESGVEQVKSFLALGGAIVKLFFAIAGPGGGAAEGKNIIDSTTKAIDKLTASISGGGKGAEFLDKAFRIMRQTFEDLKPVFAALGREFNLTFSEKGGGGAVRGFATFMATTLIPGIGSFIRTIGEALGVVGDFVRLHPLVGQLSAAFTGLALSFAFGAKVAVLFQPIISTVKALIAFLVPAGAIGVAFRRMALAAGVFLVSFDKIGAAFLRISALGARFLIPFGLIASAILFLLIKFKLLDDALRAFGGFFTSLFDRVRPSVQEFVSNFQELIDAVGKGEGLFGLLAVVLRFVMKLAIDVGAVFLRIFGDTLGGAIAGVIDLLGGIVRVITGIIQILSGDFSKGFSNVFGGIGDIIVSFLQGLVVTAGNIGREIGNAIGNGIRSAVNFITSQINQLIPDEIGLGVGPSIDLPDNPIPRVSTGAYVGGSYSEGDKYPAFLSGQEVVLNPKQQAMIGVGKIMSVLQSTGAQVIGKGNGRYATGAMPSYMIGAVISGDGYWYWDAGVGKWKPTPKGRKRLAERPISRFDRDSTPTPSITPPQNPPSARRQRRALEEAEEARTPPRYKAGGGDTKDDLPSSPPRIRQPAAYNPPRISIPTSTIPSSSTGSGGATSLGGGATSLGSSAAESQADREAKRKAELAKRRALEFAALRRRFMSGIDAITAQFSALGIVIEQANASATAMTKLLAQGVKRISGVFRKTAILTGSALLTREINDLQEANSGVSARAALAQKGLSETNRKLKQIEAGGVSSKEKKIYDELIGKRQEFTNELTKLDGEYAQNLAEIYAKTVERFNKQTEEALNNSEVTAARINIAERIATAFGNTDGVLAAGQATLQNLRVQQQIIIGRMQAAQALAATDPRWNKLAQDLVLEAEGFNAQIAEQLAKNIGTAISAAEANFSRQNAGLDLRGRANDLLGAAGDRRGAASGAIELSRQRGGVISGQITALQGILGVTDPRDVGHIQELKDKIEDLTVQLAENDQATQELITASRQLSLDIINGITTSRTGLIGSATSIIEGLGELTGVLDTDKIKAFLDATSTALRDGAAAIGGEISAAINDPNNPFGVFSDSVEPLLAQLQEAFQTGPAEFATTLANLSPQIATLLQSLPEPIRNLFQNFIDSMVGNTEATIENNNKISELTKPSRQQFSTTSFKWLRQAIFDGEGSLLPQFNMPIPSLNGGAYIERDGMALLHAGETVVPATVNRNSSATSVREGDINLTVHEAGQPIDARHISSLIAFERRAAGNRR